MIEHALLHGIRTLFFLNIKNIYLFKKDIAVDVK
jgi:hypothetical protein